MKQLQKVFYFFILPITSLIAFVLIGKMREESLNELDAAYPNMSGAIAAIAWTYRGILVALLVALISYIIYSKLSEKKKTQIVFSLAILNLIYMGIMHALVYTPYVILIIPFTNIAIVALIIFDGNID